MNSADLELEIYRRGTEEYAINFRFTLPNNDVESRFDQPDQVKIQFNFAELRQLLPDPEKYGRALSRQVFEDPGLCAAFGKTRAISAGAEVPLRLRLFIAPSAPELHALRWETLADPDRLDDPIYAPLAMDQNLIFSRYLTSGDWRTIRLKPKGDLHALVVVASPDDLVDSFQLDAIDTDGEISRARQGLEGIPMTLLPDDKHPATLENLIEFLQGEQSFDILYLVCHGKLKDGQSILYLEDEKRKTRPVRGAEILERIRVLPERPRLVVLVSCQSAGSGTGGALSALGPQLAEIGVPAVLAMQDNISLATAAQFLSVFFRKLQRDGEIDQALAAARGAVRTRFDFWVPVLFMRLKSGRLWYKPGFSDGSKGFDKFPAQVRAIRKGDCTPILGPGLVEPILGSLREVARRWAERFRYPLSPSERESLPQVAQFLSVNQDKQFPFDDLEDALKKHILEHFKPDLPQNLLSKSASLNELISAVGQVWRRKNPLEPHRVLASLPLSIFITANQDMLLEDALREARKQPQTVLCPWNEFIERRNMHESGLDLEPEVECPLVYHLFGTWDQPDSVVLTEDHYFDFLIGNTQNHDLVDKEIRSSLSKNSLLFLGFQTHEWSFRVIFRTLIAQEGASLRDRYVHIAAQIEPEDGRILEPERARRYLEQYFIRDAIYRKTSSIDIFWGSPEEFLSEMARYLNEKPQ